MSFFFRFPDIGSGQCPENSKNQDVRRGQRLKKLSNLQKISAISGKSQKRDIGRSQRP